MAYDASNIRVLEGLEAVRVRPAMYIGSTDQKGYNHLLYEILDNAVDEAGNGYGKNITVALYSDGWCKVEDEGRGIPVDLHESGVSALRVVLTTLHAGGKFDSTAYKVSGGLHGVGSSVVNALSEQMIVNVYKNGNIYEDRYSKGVPTVELEEGMIPVVGNCLTNKTGTCVRFKPDTSIFSVNHFDVSSIKEHLHTTAYLNPELYITFIDDTKNTNQVTRYHEPESLKAYIRDINKDVDVICEPFSFQGSYATDKGDIDVYVVIQYVQSSQEHVYGFCNNIVNHEGGTHVSAFKSCITSIVNQYAKQLGVVKDKSDMFTGSDVRCGLTAAISVDHPDPQFEGQTKTKLNNSDVVKAVNTVCSKQLTLYFDRNISVIKSIIAIAEKARKFRKAEAKSKNSLFSSRKRYSFDSNGKLAGCESREYDKNELFIVEGDSAAGSGKMARDRKHQAILPIRGKILNVEKATTDKILANSEIKTIIYALGCGFGEGYGNDFDISKLKFGKVIIMTDSDVDGSHITTLLMTLFYRLIPEIVTQGHLYCAVSPLYKVFPVKGDTKYIYTDTELNKYLEKNKVTHIQRYKGLGEMNPDQLWETTMNPQTRLLKRVVIEDIAKADSITSRLMGGSSEYRKAFIHDNAQFADIDV